MSVPPWAPGCVQRPRAELFGRRPTTVENDYESALPSYVSAAEIRTADYDGVARRGDISARRQFTLEKGNEWEFSQFGRRGSPLRGRGGVATGGATTSPGRVRSGLTLLGWYRNTPALRNP